MKYHGKNQKNIWTSVCFFRNIRYTKRWVFGVARRSPTFVLEGEVRRRAYYAGSNRTMDG